MTGPGFKDHFSEVAAGYAANRPTYPAALAAFLAEVAPRPGVAWEAGCGSGQLSVVLADRFERVIATDASAEQLERATPHPGVQYRRAAAEASGLPDGSVDAAVSAQAAHWFDLPAYYAEVRRVARPHAIVVQTVYNHALVNEAVDTAVRRFYADKLLTFWPPERRHVEAYYATLPFPFEPVPTRTFEMTARWDLGRFIGFMRSWSGVAALEKALGPEPMNALEQELRPLWGPDGSVRDVRWPLVVRVGRLGVRV